MLRVRLLGSSVDSNRELGEQQLQQHTPFVSNLSFSSASPLRSGAVSVNKEIASCSQFYGGPVGDACSGSDWIFQFALLCDSGTMLLFDPTAGGKPKSADGIFCSELGNESLLRAKISLKPGNVWSVRSKDKGLHCFELSSRSAGAPLWQFIPAGMVAAENKGCAAQKWIDSLWPFCCSATIGGDPVPNSVRILLCGHLSKRGEVNTSYKRRWFVYTTDGKISYYQDTAWRGSISLDDLESVCFSSSDASKGKRVASGAGDADSAKLCALTEFVINTSKRIFYLMADSPEDASRWVCLLRSTQGV